MGEEKGWNRKGKPRRNRISKSGSNQRQLFLDNTNNDTRRSYVWKKIESKIKEEEEGKEKKGKGKKGGASLGWEVKFGPDTVEVERSRSLEYVYVVVSYRETVTLEEFKKVEKAKMNHCDK